MANLINQNPDPNSNLSQQDQVTADQFQVALLQGAAAQTKAQAAQDAAQNSQPSTPPIIGKAAATPSNTTTSPASTSPASSTTSPISQLAQHQGIPAPPEASSGTSTGSSSASSSSSSGAGSKYQFINSALANSIVTSIISGSGISNALNQYQNVAYHFRLFCVNDLNLYQAAGNPSTAAAFYQTIIPDPNQPIGVKSSNAGKISSVIVAESGSTIYNIKSVEFTSLIGPNIDTRNVTIGTFTMTIIEPLGGSFLTALRAASDACNNFNFKNCFYYLELSFKAYNTDGTPVSGPNGIFPKTFEGTSTPLTMQQGDRWIWEVQITDIDSKIDAGGSTYDISLINSDGMAFDDEIHAVPDSISISGATLGDYFKNLGTALSTSWFQRYQNYDVKFGDGTIPAFKFFPIQLNGTTTYPGVQDGADPATFQIIDPTLSPNVQGQQTKATELENGYITGVVQPGVTIEKMIESAIGATKQGQILGYGGQNPTNTIQQTGTQPLESIVFRVIPSVVINGYNYYSGRYQITITYNIVPFYTQYPILTPTQVFNDSSQTAVANLINRGLLQKKYEYIFTGMNTEVLDLNIQINAKWTAQIPTAYGLPNSTQSLAPNKSIGSQANISTANVQTALQASLSKASTLAQQITQVANLGAAENQSYDDLTTGVASDTNQAVISSQDATTQAATIAANASNDTTLLSNANQNIVNNNAQIAAINSAAGKTLINPLPLNAPTVAAAQAELDTAKNQAAGIGNTLQTQFGGVLAPYSKNEYNITSGSVSFAEELILSKGGTFGTFVFPITFSQNYKESSEQTGTNFVNDINNDKSLLGAVLNQLYDYASDPLMMIDLTIRGDPYWLGETNLSKCVYFRGPATPPEAGSYQSPQMFGETNFVLDFKIPFQVSSNTNNFYQPQLVPDEAYHGVYIVSQVKNTFEDGQFTQVLTGKRQPLINLLRAQGLTTAAVLADGSMDDSGASSSNQASGASSSTGSGTAGSGASDGTVSSATTGNVTTITGTNGNTAQVIAGTTQPTPQQQQTFLSTIYPAAYTASQQLNVPVSAILAQTALETNYGTSIAYLNNNNVAGINVPGSQTGTDYQTYSSPGDSVSALASLIQNAPHGRYSAAIGATTPLAYGQALQQAGYATAQNYGTSISNVANSPTIQNFITQQDSGSP